MNEQSVPMTAEEIVALLRMAVDTRTCLIIGEIVKDGKRIEVFRKRSESLISVVDDVIVALKDCFKNTDAKHINPDEVVVRILRPVQE